MITEIEEESVMKREGKSRQGGDIEVSSYHSYTYEKRTDLYRGLSDKKKNIFPFSC